MDVASSHDNAPPASLSLLLSLSLEEMIQSSSMAPWRQSRKRAREDGAVPPRCCVHCRELGVCTTQLEYPDTSDEIKVDLWELLAKELPSDKHLCDKKRSPDIQALIQTALRTLQSHDAHRLAAAKVLSVLVFFRSNYRAFIASCSHLKFAPLLAQEAASKSVVKALARCVTGLKRVDTNYYTDVIDGLVKDEIARATTRPSHSAEKPVYLQNLVRVYQPQLKRVYLGVPRGVSKVMLARDLMEVLQDENAHEMAKLAAIAYFHVALGLDDSSSGDKGDNGSGDTAVVTLSHETLTTDYVLRESIEDVIALAVETRLQAAHTERADCAREELPGHARHDPCTRAALWTQPSAPIQ